MTTYEKFYSSILPGNYALTKSMELTKVNTSGTLWYIKKFLVLYYYVFLSNGLMTREYIQKVVEAFDRFIESLPPAVREEANRFFYPENDTINFKSDNFKSFSAFAAVTEFDALADRDEYYKRAKKVYFALLMGSGGQTGVKKVLKQTIERSDFVYSDSAINSAIMNAVVDVCVEQINDTGDLSDNSVEKIISAGAIDEIKTLALTETLTQASVRAIIDRRTDNCLRYKVIENDVVAFIRNERQLMYYHGYFHSRSAGATDEFSSLTPVGEIALNANYYEFLVIWEHQKIKMISQPATADINNIVACENDPISFGISYTPYTDILGHIDRRGSLSVDEYKYIVSRRSHDISENEWIDNEAEIVEHLNDLRALVQGFSRASDKTNDDGRKELLKYALGVRTDLSSDAGTNEFGAIERRRNFSVTNAERLARLYKIYFGLETYKIARYQTLFEDCERDLRRRYRNALADGDITVDPRVKIDWDLYNIRVDKTILLGVAITETAFRLSLDLFDGGVSNLISRLLPALNERYGSLLRTIGYRSDAAKRKQIRKIINALRSDDYSDFIDGVLEDRAQAVADYHEADTNDLLSRICELSASASVLENGERVRKANLIALLKSYYIARFSNNGLLKCECCGQETFVTKAGEPYVEFHHLIPFNIAEGPDHYLNLFALCPNCHRKLHFLRIEDKQAIYSRLGENNYFHTGLVERLRELKNQTILRSYHLEYLLAENAITQEEYENITA